MAVDLVSFCKWMFANNNSLLNSFFNESLKNNLKLTDDMKVRDIATINFLDAKYIEKSYNKKSKNSVGELKSEVKTAYLSKQYSSKFENWYVAKPILSDSKNSFNIYYALYLPVTEESKVIEKVRDFFVNKNEPCFDCNYLSLTNMVTGEENVIFIGGLDEPEPACTSITKEHRWDWDIYREDCREVLYAECKTCGVKKTLVLGDDRSYRWNENHGWRYELSQKTEGEI